MWSLPLNGAVVDKGMSAFDRTPASKARRASAVSPWRADATEGRTIRRAVGRLDFGGAARKKDDGLTARSMKRVQSMAANKRTSTALAMGQAKDIDQLRHAGA